MDHSGHQPVSNSKLSGPIKVGIADELHYLKSGELEARVLMKYQ
jgi:hypothetical protein